MLGRHVSRYLSAFIQHELSNDQAASVAEHLLHCDRCRKELDKVEWGISLAKQLPTLPAPSRLSNAMDDILRSGYTAARVSTPRLSSRARRWAIPVAAAIVAASLGGVLWYTQLRPPISIQSSTRSPTMLEAIALDLHLQQRKGLDRRDFSTDDPRALREWAAQKTGLDIELGDQPAGDNEKYKVQGARVLTTADKQMLSVFFQVDQTPVTLITAPVSALPKSEVPSKGILQKKIIYRFDASSGTNLLSWTRENNQTYVLASDLPNLGRAGCFVCHINPQRRELIANAKLQR